MAQPTSASLTRLRTTPPPGPSGAVLAVLYVLLALAPLGLAAWAGERTAPFARELAIGAGLVAYAMLLLQFVSSGRFERLSGRAGIDRTMRFHQLAARTALLLVLLHPLLFVAPAALDDPVAAARRLWGMFQSPRLLSGVVALVAALLIVPLAIWRRWLRSYELWRASHVLAALAIAGFGGHHVLTLGDYSGTPALWWFWWVLIALAVGSFAWVYVVRPAQLWRRAYRVRSNRRVGEGMWELTLEPARGRAIAFRPGQFAWVNFARLPVPLFDHPFSFATSPADLPRVGFLIKEQGDFTRRIGAIPEGATAWLDGPHGNFTFGGKPADSFCLFAGGAGVAPILSLLRDLHAAGDRRPVALVQAARRAERLVYRDEIVAMARTLDLRTTYVVEEPPPGWTGPVGMVTPDVVAAALEGKDPRRTLCFICGPLPMMLAIADALRRAGVPDDRIVYERFVYD